jgi:hypothetical protein
LIRQGAVASARIIELSGGKHNTRSRKGETAPSEGDILSLSCSLHMGLLPEVQVFQLFIKNYGYLQTLQTNSHLSNTLQCSTVECLFKCESDGNTEERKATGMEKNSKEGRRRIK